MPLVSRRLAAALSRSCLQFGSTGAYGVVEEMRLIEAAPVNMRPRPVVDEAEDSDLACLALRGVHTLWLAQD